MCLPTVLIPVGGELFRLEDAALPSVAAVVSPDGEHLLQGPSTLIRVSGVVAWMRWLTALACVLLIVSSLLFAVVWLVRQHVLSAAIPALSLRAWPAATSLCITAAIGLVMFAQAGSLEKLGTLTIYSGGYWLLTLVYAAFAFWSAANIWLIEDGHTKISLPVRYHSMLVVAANLIVLAYLGYYGMIGFRFWAY